MTEKPIYVYPRLDSLKQTSAAPSALPVSGEGSSCAESEPFALRVLDDSMQPEFRKGCIIIIDPAGVARDGSYVLAQNTTATLAANEEGVIDGLVFRQLQRREGHWYLAALNETYPAVPTKDDLGEVIGVIVQRAGTRRRYHKHYD